MKDNRHILSIVVVMMLVSFMSLSFAVSYSYITQAKINKNTVRYVTTNMNFSQTITQSSSTVFGTQPNLTKYATFTFAKPSTYSSHYYITVLHNVSASSTVQSTYVPYDDLWIQLFNGNSSGAPTTAITEPTRISDNTILAPSTPNYANAEYIIHRGILNSSTTSKKIAAVIWVDPEKAAVNNGKKIDVALKIWQYPLYHSSYHTISGFVYDSSGNPLSGASVIFQNVVAATTSSTGAYSITNVPMGSWKLDVRDNSTNELYSTTIRSYGSTVGIAVSGSYVCTSGYYAQRVAYSRYTTPYKILLYSGMPTNSNYVPDAVECNTQPYHHVKLTDTFDNLPMSNVNIILKTDHTLTLSYSAS